MPATYNQQACRRLAAVVLGCRCGCVKGRKLERRPTFYEMRIESIEDRKWLMNLQREATGNHMHMRVLQMMAITDSSAEGMRALHKSVKAIQAPTKESLPRGGAD